MFVWLAVIVPSAVVGMLCAIYLKKPWAKYAAAAIPWFCLLGALLITEYFVEYQGGGASMWPIALFFGGTVAAVSGVVAFSWAKKNIVNEGRD